MWVMVLPCVIPGYLLPLRRSPFRGLASSDGLPAWQEQPVPAGGTWMM